MPTDTHDDVHDENDDHLRARFRALGRHLEESLDRTADEPAAVPVESPGRSRSADRQRFRRRLVPIAAALLLTGGAAIWLTAPDRGSPTAVSMPDGQPVTDGASTGSPSDTDDPWPPPAEVHEHCIEDAETRALYADEEDRYPSESIRAQHCEQQHHDLPVPVMTPDGDGIGAVSSAALADPAPSDEFAAALAAHGFDGNDLGVQKRAAGLWEAFQTRHAIPVIDRDEQQVGWFAGRFLSMEDMAGARDDAERMIAEFERSGALPPP